MIVLVVLLCGCFLLMLCVIFSLGTLIIYMHCNIMLHYATERWNAKWKKEEGSKRVGLVGCVMKQSWLCLCYVFTPESDGKMHAHPPPQYCTLHCIVNCDALGEPIRGSRAVLDERESELLDGPFWGMVGMVGFKYKNTKHPKYNNKKIN